MSGCCSVGFGQLACGSLEAASSRLRLILSHFDRRAAKLLLPSGMDVLDMTALMAFLIFSDVGATASDPKLVPAFRRGISGHCHAVPGTGPSGKSPSATFRPSHDPSFATDLVFCPRVEEQLVAQNHSPAG